MTERSNPKRHPNTDGRRSLQAAELASFMKQYGRRAQKGGDPNDRQFDKDVARRVKRMDPNKLDHLMREDEN